MDVQSILLVARRLHCTLLWSQEKLALTTCGLLTQHHAATSELGELEVATLLEAATERAKLLLTATQPLYQSGGVVAEWWLNIHFRTALQ